MFATAAARCAALHDGLTWSPHVVPAMAARSPCPVPTRRPTTHHATPRAGRELATPVAHTCRAGRRPPARMPPTGRSREEARTTTNEPIRFITTANNRKSMRSASDRNPSVEERGRVTRVITNWTQIFGAAEVAAFLYRLSSDISKIHAELHGHGWPRGSRHAHAWSLPSQHPRPCRGESASCAPCAPATKSQSAVSN
jgi:hypothetical protein